MRSLVAILVLLGGASVASAHGMRTAYLELTESDDGAVLVTWKTTVADATVRPRLPGRCMPIGDEAAASPNARTFSVRCEDGLGGSAIGVDGLGPVLTEAVIRVLRPDGTVLSHVATRSDPLWVLPAETSAIGVGLDYVRLGVEHILEGLDHLLFLLALVLYVRRPRAVLVTETCFTVSHSVTFSATALGWIHVSPAAAEAAIALSLILVALDVGTGAALDEAAWQGPLIALVFGLVHGLGFAGALGAVGLPDHAVASALVGFGLGVEIGQIVFLVIVLLGLWALGHTRPLLVPRVAVAGSYLVGVTGSYWLFERLRICFT
jgi:hydrogenase/urease accessory protein HupE